MPEKPPVGRRNVSSGKRCAYRLMAILLGISPLLVIEGVLRATPWGVRSEVSDPYLGFQAVHPLFVLDEQRERFVTDPARHAYFRPESFAARKPDNEFRVFCLGGSTVQGRPYAIETSFTTWLELSLRAAAPSRAWEVVNCGGVSYASYRLAPILRELLDHQPDLFVIYTGHNEFLEDRTYRKIKATDRRVANLHGWFSRSRFYNLCRSTWLRATAEDIREPSPDVVLPAEVDALLDYRGGLDDYHRDEQWRAGATEHFRVNLRRMIEMARGASVPVILVNPVVNLRDCPPFKYEHRADLSADELATFESLWEQARDTDDMFERIELLERAIEVDDRFAAAHYSLAKAQHAAGRRAAARRSYLRAKEEDICALRMIEPLYRALGEVARRSGTPLVDARGFFESRSRDSIPGDDWMLDHVHPSINGHQEIARLILDEMARMRLLKVRAGWEADRGVAYDAHLETLSPAYFVHGRQRLRGLISWTQGRAEGRRPKNQKSPAAVDAAAQ